MSPEKNPSATDPPHFEEALGRLEEIVRELEEGKIGLAESLAHYEEGVKLLRQCHTLLEGAERKIMLLSGVDAEGNPVVVPFDEEEATSLEAKARSRSRRRSAKSDDSAEKPRHKSAPAEEPDAEEPGLF